MASRSPGQHLKDLLSHARWALGVTWKTNAQLCGGIMALVFLRALLPAVVILILRGLINEAVVQIEQDAPRLTPLLPWLTAGLAVTLIDAIAKLARRYVGLRLNNDLNVKVTSDILEHASRLDVTYFEDPDSQDGLMRAQQNTANFFSSFLTNTLDAVSQMIQSATLIVILVAIEPLLLMVLVVLAPLYLRFQWHLAQDRYEVEYNRATKKRWTRYFMNMNTTMPVMAEVRLLGLAPLLKERFHTLMSEFRDEDKKLYARSLKGSSLFTILTSTAFYLLLARVTLRALQGAATLGDVAVFGGATARLRSAIEGGINSLTNAMAGALFISNLRTLLETEPSVKRGEGMALPACRGQIAMDHVSFSYPGSKTPVLHDISLQIDQGETVALVGENGAGKTTMVKLIARLYDPTSGCIRLDGHDLRDIDPDYLATQIAFVFQHFGRYEASAEENIAYGDWERLLGNRAAVEDVARRAGISDLIENLPQGYDTMLGRRFGQHDLSGGQWQRMAVARAFARKGSLLILDEPSSNLDAKAEYELFMRSRDLAAGRTTILVSHRFSTVSMANRIIVLDNGRILESGTHSELLARDGHYATLYGLHQMQKETAV